MSDEKKKPEADSGGQDELLGKIKVLEEALESIEQSRKQKSMISLIGLILVILGIILFFLNLKSFAEKTFSDEANQKELMNKMYDNVLEIGKNNVNLKFMEKEFREDILPYVSQQIIDKFKQDAPKFQKEGENFAVEMENYLNDDVKEKLIKALSESLLEVEVVLNEKYPKMTPDELRIVLDEARRIFIIRITGMIEEKLDYISKDLGSLKKSVDQFKNCPEYKAHDPKNPETNNYVKIKMVEAMLELVLCKLREQGEIEPFHLSPGVTGGVK